MSKLICGYCGKEISESEQYFLHPNGTELLHEKCSAYICGNPLSELFGKSLQEIRDALEIVALLEEMKKGKSDDMIGLTFGDGDKWSVKSMGEGTSGDDIEHFNWYFDDLSESDTVLECLREATKKRGGEHE